MSDLLKYKKVELEIKKSIDGGSWKPDTRIPPEKDLVHQFGVSLITVKKAINNLIEQGVLESREGRRGAYVRTRNIKAKNTGPTLIGVVIDSVQEQFGADILRGIENHLYKKGYHTILCDSGRDPVKVVDFFEGLADTKLAGVILSPVIVKNYNECNTDIIKIINNIGCPYVLLDRYVKGLTSNHVSSNHELSARLITETLLAEGHKKILTFTSLFCTSMQDRFIGFKDALVEKGLSLDERLVINLDDNIDYLNDPVLVEEVRSKIQSAGEFSAFYAMNTRLLKIGVSVLEDMNYLPSKELRIAVNDNDFHKDFSQHNKILHTMQPSYETGRLAAKLIVDLIDDKPDYAVQYILSDMLSINS